MISDDHLVLELGLPRHLAVISAIVVSVDRRDESTFNHRLSDLDTFVVSRLVNDVLRLSLIESFVMARKLVFLEANTSQTELFPAFLFSSVLNH